MNESFVTVVGNVVADPISRPTKASGKPFASFRVASTTRRWDVENRSFVDGTTNYVNVVAFNALGANVMASLSRGHPVIVYGRLRVNQWTTQNGDNRTSVEVDAYSVGHDLSRGQTTISRAERAQYQPGDRLGDANIQETLARHEEAERLGTASADEAGTTMPLEEGGSVDVETGEVYSGPLVTGITGIAGIAGITSGGFDRALEDADTDDYVVVATG